MLHQVTWEKSGVYVFHGEILSHTIFDETYKLVFNDPKIDQLKYIICDFSGVKVINLQAENMIEIAACDYGASTYLPGLNIAIVTTNPVIATLFESYFQTIKELGTPWKYRIFDNISTARDWFQTDKSNN